MKFGKSMMVDLVHNWKALLIYILIIQMMVSGLILAFPSMEMLLDTTPEGADNITVETVEGVGNQTVTLSWEAVSGAANYTVLVNAGPQMITPQRVEGIGDTEYVHVLTEEDGEVPLRYFSVVAVLPGGDLEFIGMQTNTAIPNIWDSFYWSDMSDINGIIALFWDVWWILLIGLFLVYMAVSVVNRDLEENRMDILLSTLLTRRQYVLEKFVFLAAYTVVMLAVTMAFMVVSLASIGELGNVSITGLTMSVAFSLPLFLAFIAVSLLVAVGMKDQRRTVGFAFLIFVIQYGLYLFGNMAESLSSLKMLSILNYWDHRGMLYDQVYSMGDLGVLIAVTAAALLLAVAVMERKDIPS